MQGWEIVGSNAKASGSSKALRLNEGRASEMYLELETSHFCEAVGNTQTGWFPSSTPSIEPCAMICTSSTLVFVLPILKMLPQPRVFFLAFAANLAVIPVLP